MTSVRVGTQFGLVIPTLNAGPWLDALISSIETQSLMPQRIIVLDSASDDETPERFRQLGAEVVEIDRAAFDHGGTRQLGADLLGELPIVVFLTQDAVLANDNALELILRHFEDPAVGVVYGRQLPRPGAGLIESHARIFNYSDQYMVDSADTLQRRGLRGAFCSNSFSAYRREALSSIGGFPEKCIFGEDMLAAIELMRAGWLKVYSPSSKVFHSHKYNITQEFRRSFDIGAMHDIEAERLGALRSVGGEGFKFVKSELAFLLVRNPLQIPSAVLRTAAKLGGYWMGGRHRSLPPAIKRLMGLNRSFWVQKAELTAT